MVVYELKLAHDYSLRCVAQLSLVLAFYVISRSCVTSHSRVSSIVFEITVRSSLQKFNFFTPCNWSLSRDIDRSMTAPNSHAGSRKFARMRQTRAISLRNCGALRARIG